MQLANNWRKDSEYSILSVIVSGKKVKRSKGASERHRYTMQPLTCNTNLLELPEAFKEQLGTLKGNALLTTAFQDLMN